MTHPLYARPLVNRNPAQTNRNYVMGGDSWVSTLPDTVVRAGIARSAQGSQGTDACQDPPRMQQQAM